MNEDIRNAVTLDDLATALCVECERLNELIDELVEACEAALECLLEECNCTNPDVYAPPVCYHCRSNSEALGKLREAIQKTKD